MNPFPEEKSVLLLDNCSIHKSKALKELVDSHGTSICMVFHPTSLLTSISGCYLYFIPAYSPDFNPIEEAFSTSTLLLLSPFFISPMCHLVKSWIRRNYRRMEDSNWPEIDLIEACYSVTPEMASGYFRHAGFH